jgi:hypothetical protein
MTVSYQNRQGRKRDLPTAPKLVIANHLLQKYSGFSIGDRITVQYLPESIIIRKLT